MVPKRDINYFNPFHGLRPFTSEDSDLFFGRETESNEIITKLLKNRYITVIGASGSGKSSLIYAGVLPKIRDLKNGKSSSWKIISFNPDSDPFGNLAGALSKVISESTGKSADREVISSLLSESTDGLSDVARKILENNEDNILLVIDQFDELFRYILPGSSDISHTTAIKFVEFLVSSVINPAQNVFLIITMRSEYLGECSHYKGLTKLVNNSNYLVSEMGTESLKEVIEGPVNFLKAKIDPELVMTILSDLNGMSGKLPVLQHAMMRTWDHWHKLYDKEKPVSMADYNSAGTIRNAVSHHANEVYEGLNQRGKEICSIMFKTITRKGLDNKGFRHPSDIETIRSVAGCTEDELTSVVEKFRARPGSFIIPGEGEVLSNRTIIDLQSECLILLWDRLKEWIDSEASSMQIYLRLSEASALYQQGKTGLYRPPDILNAIVWRDKSKPTISWAVQYNPAFERAMVYLRTSEKAYNIDEQNKIILEKRKQKRTRSITRFLGITVIVVLAIMLFEHIKRSTAEKKIIIAESQKNQAVKEKARADSTALLAMMQKTVSDSTAANAIKDAETVRKQKIEADREKSIAKKSIGDALQQKDLAEEKSEGDRRLRLLSIGKSMSLRSLQMAGQKDLQTLLAYQAYLFNKNNNGLDNDADIYAGLYNVALQYGSLNFKSFKGHTSDIKSIAFVPGRNEFFTSGNDGKVLKWSLEKKDQTLQVMYSGSDIIEVLAVSPDASWLACGSSNSTIRMIPLKGDNSGYEMNGHKGGVKSLIFSYDGRYLYSAALDGKVLKWDIAARTSINVSTGLMEISSIDLSSKGNYLAGISTDGNVVVWNPDHSSDNFRIETTGRNISVVRFNPENNLLALGDSNGNVELWDISLHKKISEVKADGSAINDIRFNTILKQMATSGNDKKIKIFNIKDPVNLTEPPITMAGYEGIVIVMQFSPDGQMIISGESGGSYDILSRPAHADLLIQGICKLVSRNLTQDEWNNYVGKDIPLEKACPEKSFNIKVEPITSFKK
jgi:WD40 repeat protein